MENITVRVNKVLASPLNSRVKILPSITNKIALLELLYGEENYDLALKNKWITEIKNEH